MCGIWGIAGDNLNDQDINIFTNLLASNSERGQRGVGFLIDQQRYRYWKNLEDEDYEFDPRIHPQYLMCGHTRAPTEGAPVDEENTHPFELNSYYLAHNGMLINYSSLWGQFSIPEEIRTDSAVILYYFNDLKTRGVPDFDALKTVCESIQGQFACWLVDSLKAYIYLFRVISPIYIRQDHLNRGRRVYFSSTSFPESTLLKEGKIIRIDARLGTITEFRNFQYYTPYAI